MTKMNSENKKTEPVEQAAPPRPLPDEHEFVQTLCGCAEYCKICEQHESKHRAPAAIEQAAGKLETCDDHHADGKDGLRESPLENPDPMARGVAEYPISVAQPSCEDCVWHECAKFLGGCGCKCHRPPEREPQRSEVKPNEAQSQKLAAIEQARPQPHTCSACEQEAYLNDPNTDLDAAMMGTYAYIHTCKSAAAEPAPERTPPRWKLSFLDGDFKDSDYFLESPTGERFWLGQEHSDWRTVLDILNARAVAVPEPAPIPAFADWVETKKAACEDVFETEAEINAAKETLDEVLAESGRYLFRGYSFKELTEIICKHESRVPEPAAQRHTFDELSVEAKTFVQKWQRSDEPVMTYELLKLLSKIRRSRQGTPSREKFLQQIQSDIEYANEHQKGFAWLVVTLERRIAHERAEASALGTKEE